MLSSIVTQVHNLASLKDFSHAIFMQYLVVSEYPGKQHCRPCGHLKNAVLLLLAMLS